MSDEVIHKTTHTTFAGVPLRDSTAAIILLHGRGATAQHMVGLFNELKLDNVTAIAPQATGQTWYPQSFLALLESNQPYLDSALKRVGAEVTNAVNAGISPERIVLLGFSQGACLVSEFVARNPRRYGAVIALTGGLIGPRVDQERYVGAFDGTPVLLTTGNNDPHVPLERVTETERVLNRMGAKVDMRIYKDRPHTVSSDELEMSRRIIQEVTSIERG